MRRRPLCAPPVVDAVAGWIVVSAAARRLDIRFPQNERYTSVHGDSGSTEDEAVVVDHMLVMHPS